MLQKSNINFLKKSPTIFTAVLAIFEQVYRIHFCLTVQKIITVNTSRLNYDDLLKPIFCHNRLFAVKQIYGKIHPESRRSPGLERSSEP